MIGFYLTRLALIGISCNQQCGMHTYTKFLSTYKI